MKILKRCICLFLLIVSGCAATTVKAENHAVADSLYQALKHIQGQDKLEGYYEFILENVNKLPGDEIISIYEIYLEEARKQGAIQDEAYAASGIIKVLRDLRRFDKMQELMPETLQFFKKNKLWKRYYDTYISYVEYYLMIKKYQTAMREAMILYDDVRERNDELGIACASYMIGLSYHLMERDEADEYYRQSLLYFEKESQKNIKNSTLMFTVFKAYSEYLYHNKEYRECLNVCISWKEKLARYAETLDNVKYENYIAAHEYILNTSMSMALIGSNELDSAQVCIDKMKQYLKKIKKGDNLYSKILIMRMESLFYEAQGNFEAALDYTSKVLELEKQIDPDNKNVNTEKMNIARLLYMTNDYKKAYEILNEAYLENDSIQKQEASLQLDELSSLYKVDKLTMEKEKLKDYLIFVITSAIFICLILVISIVYAIRIRKKNKAIYNSIVDSIEVSAVKDYPDCQEENEQDKSFRVLFDSINEVLDNEKLFKNPEFSRKMLADRLGTNQKYIADTIKSFNDSTFNEYINAHRLKYACLLLLRRQDLTLDMIAVESGFKSRSNFYTQFRCKYSMSPGDFRKVNNVENKL